MIDRTPMEMLVTAINQMERRLVDTAALALHYGADPARIAHLSGLSETEVWDRNEQLKTAGELR